MDDRDALHRAVAAAPDDDLPRLVFADWAEEQGDEPYAAFIRAQVELARTPPWEPFAVRCRHRHADEWVRGTPFRHHLPELAPRGGLEWHPESVFRRGFAWSLIVRDLATFFTHAARLFDVAPIGQLYLPTGTLDDWRRFARQPWLPRVQSIHFYGTSTPVEPVRVLCASDTATGLTEVVFEASSGPGMPDVLAGLLTAPAGRRLRSLELRVGPVPADELLIALAEAPTRLPLERLSLVNVIPPGFFGLTYSFGRGVFSRLTALDLANVPKAFRAEGFERFSGLVSVRLAGCHIGADMSMLPREFLVRLPALRALDLSDNPIGSWLAVGSDDGRGEPTQVRSFKLRKSALENGVHWIERLPFWAKLVELDLRNNGITDDNARWLLDADPSPDLTALLLGGNPIGETMQRRLRDHFGDIIDFDAGDVGNGLR